ncbi:MAG: hypothetical protein KF861_14565 [Planctomycetaceae bacterium]|nr:hypothetical protein [Planctomycetaceae bacterium]
MKALKNIAALTIVAGGFVLAGLSSSADAGGYGGYGYGYGYAPSYGYSHNYYRPSYVSYPRVNLLCDSYGCHYFVDSYGIRHNCHLAFGNQYYYFNNFGAKQFVYGY